MEAVFVAPTGHPLLEGDVIEPQDLHERDFVGLASSSSMRRAFDAVMVTHRRALRIRMESLLTMIRCGLVDAGFGCAMVDPFTASRLPWRNLKIRPFRPAIHFEWSIIMPNFSPISSLATDFAAKFSKSFLRFPEEFSALNEASEAPSGRALP